MLPIQKFFFPAFIRLKLDDEKSIGIITWKVEKKEIRMELALNFRHLNK